VLCHLLLSITTGNNSQDVTTKGKESLATILSLVTTNISHLFNMYMHELISGPPLSVNYWELWTEL
jgi:hypothetical protein